jgi:hypothetical protein
MSRISSCASCHGDIMIPGFAQPQDQMRCPLCNAQFQVQDVLATSILAPPEAIRVEQPPPGVTAAVGPRLSRAEEPAELDTESIDVRPRPRKKQPGIFSHLFGIVGGGLLGLSLGYLGLLRFGGPQYDFLDVADKLPAWVTAPLPFKIFPANGNGEQRDEANEHTLKNLLEQPDQPPTVDVPGPADRARPDTEAPPFPPSPFDPATSIPLPTAPESNDPPPAGVPVAPERPAQPPLADGLGDAPPPQTSRTGPVHFTAYSAEDLTLAVGEVTSALHCPACGGSGYLTRSVVTGAREVNGAKVQQAAERRMPCDVCGGKPVTKMTPELYAKLCHLAEVVTFVSKGDANTWSQRETVQNLLVSAAADQRVAEAIGRLAGFQLDLMRHKDHGTGIALAGTVQELSQVGSLYAMRIVLFGLPKVVTVVSWRPAQPAINEHDRVIILGSIVDDPVDNLAGYEGRLPLVVWGGLPAKLPPQP